MYIWAYYPIGCRLGIHFHARKQDQKRQLFERVIETTAFSSSKFGNLNQIWPAKFCHRRRFPAPSKTLTFTRVLWKAIFRVCKLVKTCF